MTEQMATNTNMYQLLNVSCMRQGVVRESLNTLDYLEVDPARTARKVYSFETAYAYIKQCIRET